MLTINFKAKLVNTINDLDEQTDGLIINSDNFQALSLLQNKYQEKVKSIYIDPPYNTGSDGFIYKDGYAHSTWSSFLNNLMQSSIPLLQRPDGIVFGSIDDVELGNFKSILSDTEARFIGSIGWESKTKSQNTKTSYNKLQPKIEYILTYSLNEKRRFNLLQKGEKQYTMSDSNGVYREYQLETMSASGVRARDTMIFPVMGVYPPEGSQWKLGKDTIEHYENRGDIFINEKNRVTIKIRPEDEEGQIFEPFWAFIDKTSGTAESAKKELSQLVPLHGIDTVKPSEIIKKLVFHSTDESDLVLDYFAGSGTTGHAVIDLNREDHSTRKFILVEQGEYFNTVIQPRIKKIVYSKYWKNGNPLLTNSIDNEINPYQGIRHCLKVVKLESYEDTLNNLELIRTQEQEDLFAALTPEQKDDYLMHYMLDIESQGSLLNVNSFRNPFDYRLKVAVDSAGAYTEQTVDLIDTFNYLIGLTVKSIDYQLEQGFVQVIGQLRNGDDVTVFWRDCDKIGYEELDALLKKLSINALDSEFDQIYINGDHNINAHLVSTEGAEKQLKVRSIEQVFFEQMFAE